LAEREARVIVAEHESSRFARVNPYDRPEALVVALHGLAVECLAESLAAFVKS